LIKRFKNESGYSLLEVMVAIMLLTLAIIPMVGMFDAGLRAATQGGDYDKARALANKQIETAKNLSYQDARDKFPVGSSTPDAGTGVYESSDQTDADFPGFTYKVRKSYAKLGSTEITEDAGSRTMMKVTVTVNWGGGKSYSTTGLVSK
jgi:Tfp pilus assembly protein PilV